MSMPSIPAPALVKGIESYLLDKRKWINEQIRTIDTTDPVLIGEPESPEWATNAWEAEVHTTKVVTKNHLIQSEDEIKATLKRIARGTFGQCEGCSNPIEQERLRLISTTTLCAACAAKKI